MSVLFASPWSSPHRTPKCHCFVLGDILLLHLQYDKVREQNIEYKTILRSSLNLVVHSNYEFTVPHVDHFFPHWNWVMYLNTVENAPTVLFDENMEIIESVQAEEFKSVIFPGVTHAHKFPPINQDRCVCVFTFA